MGECKYQIVGGKTPGKSGKVLSCHSTKKAARKAAKEYQKQGYMGVITTRKKMTPRIRKLGGKGKYYYAADYRKGDFF